jgi:sorbose reductase
LTSSTVTGGAGTLALEGARALLEHGAGGVALFDINLSAVSAAVSALQADFPKALIVSKQVDVTDVVNVTSATKEVAEELGSVDILCCFAGIVNCVHAIEMAPAQWRRTLEINTTGGFFCAQAAARYVWT